MKFSATFASSAKPMKVMKILHGKKSKVLAVQGTLMALVM